MALSRRHLLSTKPEASPPSDTVNSPETIARLERLHRIASLPISLLSPEQCQDLEAVRKLARETYSTPSYRELHSRVTTLFSSTPVQEVLPHTVVAFFIGCITPTNISEAVPDVNAGCSLLCSDGLPPPDKPWGFCSQNVLWCLLSSSSTARNSRSSAQTNSRTLVNINYQGTTLPESFDFIFMTHVPSSSKAVLFIDYQSYDDFPGFTRQEKARLIYQLHITDVKLLSYEKEDSTLRTNAMFGVTYKDLIGKAVKVHALKSRADPRDSETPAEREARRAKIPPIVRTPERDETPVSWQHATMLAFALFVMVIMAVAAGFAIRSMRSSNRTKRWQT